ncbi:MAG TPA: Ku protein [Stellaceae bacterium]|nr:Ku protein [Stellaceae bacterium]
MAEAVWNGFLRLSLVSCPISLTSATSDAQRVKLDLLSARTGNPVTEQYVDAKTGDVVAKEALVKGHEFASGRYVTLSEDELAKLGSGVGNIIDLERFVPRDQIDHLYVEAAYYLHPEGQLASDTVHALRLAMRRSGRVALGHVRIGERERPALIEPHRAGLMMSTLHTQEELIVAEFHERPEDDIPAEMIEIAEAIIARRAGDFDPGHLRDRYQDDLRRLVEQKAGNTPLPPAPARRPPSTGRAVPPPAAEAAPPSPEPEPPPPEPEPAAAAPPSPLPAAAAPPPPPPEPEPPPPPVPEPPVAVQPPPREPEPVAAAPEPPPPAPEPEPEPAAAAPEILPPAPEPEPATAVAEPPPPAPEPEPAATEGIHDVGAEILLHIMGLGDRRYVEPGWAGNPGSRRQIEALSVRPREGLAASAVEFRVFAQEGRATAWVSNGNYAGTRGRNLPLTGFAVRPAEEFGDRLEIAYEGSFFEAGVVGPKRNGELCVSTVADDPLEAVRVTITDRGGE